MIASEEEFLSVLDQIMPLYKKIDHFDQLIRGIDKDLGKIIDQQRHVVPIRASISHGGIDVRYPVLELAKELENEFDGYYKIARLLLSRKKELISEYDCSAVELGSYISEKPEILGKLNAKQLYFLKTN